GADAVDRPLLALQQGALRRLDPPLLARPARRDPAVTPLLYELHDIARERGIAGYRRMTKGELAAVLDVEPVAEADGRPAAPAASAGPTEVEVTVRQRFGLVMLRGADNALSL